MKCDCVDLDDFCDYCAAHWLDSSELIDEDEPTVRDLDDADGGRRT